MNSDSIKELVDVQLWQGILECLSERSRVPSWIIQPETERRVINAKEFRELALTTEDPRELAAVALVVWFQGLSFDTFARRAVDLLDRGPSNAFLEAMLYKYPLIRGTESEGFMRNVLTQTERRNYLEMAVALEALGGDNEQLQIAMLKYVCNLWAKERDHYNVLNEADVLVSLVLKGARFGVERGYFLNVLWGYRKTIPKPSGKNFEICKAYGLSYLDQLTLSVKLASAGTGMSYSKKQELTGLILTAYGVLAREWTEVEKQLVWEEARLTSGVGFPVCNPNNFRWALTNGLNAVVGSDLEVMAPVLCRCDWKVVSSCVGNAIEKYSEPKVGRICTNCKAVLDILFSQHDEKLVGSYARVRQFLKYDIWEVDYVEDWGSEQALSLVHRISEDQESLAYQHLMSRILQESEIPVSLETEVRKYVSLWEPDDWEEYFGGEDNE